VGGGRSFPLPVRSPLPDRLPARVQTKNSPPRRCCGTQTSAKGGSVHSFLLQLSFHHLFFPSFLASFLATSRSRRLFSATAAGFPPLVDGSALLLDLNKSVGVRASFLVTGSLHREYSSFCFLPSFPSLSYILMSSLLTDSLCRPKHLPARSPCAATCADGKDYLGMLRGYFLVQNVELGENIFQHAASVSASSQTGGWGLICPQSIGPLAVLKPLAWMSGGAPVARWP
jgi:hypothetical protein